MCFACYCNHTAVEHLPLDAKLRKGREIPFSNADAEAAEYESEEPEAEAEQPPSGQQQDQEQQSQQPKPAAAKKLGPKKPNAKDHEAAVKKAAEDSDYDAEQDSDAAPLSDDEHLDTDADVSDDMPPSESDSENEVAIKARQCTGGGGSGSIRNSLTGQQLQGLGSHRQGAAGKLNTPSRGLRQARTSTGTIGPVAQTAAGGQLQPQQQLPMMLPHNTATAALGEPGAMMFVPMGAIGAPSAMAGIGAPVPKFTANGAAWQDPQGGSMSIEGAAGQQQALLGKRRTSDGSGHADSDAKRRASSSRRGMDVNIDTAGEQSDASDAFKKAMLEKLLARKAGAHGAAHAAASGGGGSALKGSSSIGKAGSRGSGIERRISSLGSGGGGSGLQRALSDVQVRHKAAEQLAIGLKKAAEEAQEKHKRQQQQLLLNANQPAQQSGVPAKGGQQQQQEAAGQQAVAAAAPPEEQTGTAEQQQQQRRQAAAVAELHLPDSEQLASTIEQHLFNLCGSVNAEYKSKLRSLAFNLRDPNNPDLRAHVLAGEIVPASLVRMSATDLANKDLAEFRRKVEEEHDKAIELDVEAAAKISTAAAWATRDERLRKKDLALMGILATEGRKLSPEPVSRLTPPPTAADTDAAADTAADGEGGLDHDHGVADMAVDHDAEYGADHQDKYDESMGDGEGGTPTRPASEDLDMDPDIAAASLAAADAAGAGGASDQALLRHQHSEQSSDLVRGLSHVGGPAVSSALASSASLGAPAGSAAAAGGTNTLLQQVGSVTSKATPAAAGGMLAGIDWAAIKSEALKSVPKDQQQAAAKQQGAAGNDEDAAAEGNVAAAAGDDAPYNPDDDDDEKPYSVTNGGNTSSAAAAGSATADTALAGAAALDPDIPDLLPVVAARPQGAVPLLIPGEPVWGGAFGVPNAGSFAAQVKYLGGMGDVGALLGAQGSTLDVIGRVALDKFAGFTEELRKSRSRTISIGLVGCAGDAGPIDAAYMHELIRGYSSKGRLGKLSMPHKDVEGYLVARSGE
eukprot:GHRR01013370.1.p1 GENE.GHRR01013370.1~~GHRR01013370.1.p1  ORF type:complete len:1025 (+),score=497.71 GHRR01013370.1:228-3302(+)